MQELKPKYPVYSQLDELLAPQTLSRLSGRQISHVEHKPLQGHSGLAGGELSQVFTDAGVFFMKRMSQEMDWVMFITEDTLCRSVTLWEYGLLDELSPYQDHKILACANTPEGWYILMEDLTGHLFAWDSTLPASQSKEFLDRLARMHALFWNDPRLDASELGLCSPAQLIGATSLPTARRYGHLKLGVLPEWISGGWAAMPNLLAGDVYAAIQELSEHPEPLYQALERWPATLLHGDFRAENLAYQDGPIVLDWQQASKSLMTIDLAWFIKNDSVRRSLSEAEAVAWYRQRLEYWLGRPFEDRAWQEMLDLGYLVDVLRSTCFVAFFHSIHTRENNLLEVKKLEQEAARRNELVRRAVRWLSKQTV